LVSAGSQAGSGSQVRRSRLNTGRAINLLLALAALVLFLLTEDIRLTMIFTDPYTIPQALICGIALVVTVVCLASNRKAAAVPP
jgi:hypothetical protein